MQIKLNTIEDVKNFVTICLKYAPNYIDVKQGRQFIDGTSILGIFSLDLLRPLNVIIDNEDNDTKISFYKDIQKFSEG